MCAGCSLIHLLRRVVTTQLPPVRYRKTGVGRNVGYVILLQGSHLRQRLPEQLHHPVPQEYGASIVNTPYPRPLPCE